MAVLTVSQKLAPEQVSYDSRFKAWAKLIASPAHVELGKTNGYSLTGPFVGWGKSAAVGAGQFLVLAAESGSRARREYKYALVRVNGADEPEVVSAEEIAAAVAQAPDAQRAKALNSPLYAFAVYTASQLADGPITRRMLAQAERASESAQLMVARRAIEVLTDDERRTLFAEFTAVAAA